MRCGLLGKKLGHSYSPQIHSFLGAYSYELFEKAPEELERFLKSGDFTGLNVTIPYKKDVLQFCDELSDRAAALGAVNTIVRRPDGKLIGHNTDYFGFASMVERSTLLLENKKVLVLGSGGASATAVAVLKEIGAQVVVISRNGENNYTNLDRHKDAAAIINTTPVGMYPNTDGSPINLDLFESLEGVLDVIYNPSKTQLLLAAEKRGLITENGLWMLVAQAKESAEWFTGTSISTDKIAQIHRTLRRQMENTILIGMPGCGKSTIGRLLAESLGKNFIDIDTEIVAQAGMTIPEIFAASGEDGFRKWETSVLSQVCKKSGFVIATGGGCVTRSENYNILHQNGNVIWLQRDLDRLATDGRPLSQKGNLDAMYLVRKPLYTAFSDAAVNNEGDLNTVVQQIISTEATL